ncbi:MAG: methyltransferase domain-containing protein [Xanthomonadales bacterium]|nr:methyltransferase domain-containing protein [Xanthomonadales bacterium]NIX13128.1 methyltransferase domain-containing protein [Xanthomonadales bacterium]
MTKINLGSGHWKLPGWVNVDLDLSGDPEVCADLSAGLPFRDAVAEFMHTEDFLDQLELEHAYGFLRECHRVLKPGGVLRVLTPDLETMARLYMEEPDRLRDLWCNFVGVPLSAGTAGEVFNLGMRHAGHTFIYDAETFREVLSGCGFDARRVAYNQSEKPELRSLDLRSPENAISMYFDCYRLER